MSAADAGWSVAVFCGSRHGRNPAHALQAKAVGEGLAARGWTLVYGGGSVGLMGVVADAALAGGGAVHGVIPQALLDLEVGHRALTRQEVVTTLSQRKDRMLAAANAFLVLPGGIGTLDELCEVFTAKQLGYLTGPVALLNVDGYFDALREALRQAAREGFMDAAHLDLLQCASEVEQVWPMLAPR